VIVLGAAGELQPQAGLRGGVVVARRSRGVRDRNVLAAMELVPREAFVREDLREFAYADRALPIDCGQIIDKPSIAGRMLEALAVERGNRVLEIGTGTGWTAAVLSRLGAEVVTMERYATLASAARERLAALGVTNVQVLHRDGLRWPTDRYHRVIVHGSVPEVTRALREAVLPGGIMVVPVGPGEGVQDLRKIVAALPPVETILRQVRLVPLENGVARVL
jgi:protein-L-isoaspartate(D-aspartate) O-methyltransferase